MLTDRESSLVRASIDHLLEGVQVIGFDWRYLYVNATAAAHGQQQADRLVGRTMMACYPGIEQTEVFRVLERVMRERQASHHVNEFVYPAGGSRWFELLVHPVPDGICVLSLDITERQRTEQQLRQAQKMEAIGTLAGGVAHDFNNVLTAILGYASLITEQIGPDKPLGVDIREIVIAAERAAALTRRLLAFSRRQEMRLGPMSLNAMVEGMEPMLRRLIPESITVRTGLADDPFHVVADRTQLEQVLLNLAVNARDAMPKGGTLTIATQNMTADEEFVRAHVNVSAGDYAVLIVSDTGGGMPPEVASRIFEPFFTTKDKSRGTGLGLAVVHGIVKQLGGDIWVYTEPERGTVFKIFLPRTLERLPEQEKRSAAPAPLGREAILLVEDEPGVRSLTRRILTRHGYTVWEADSGEAALQLLADPSRTPALLLTDVTLPGMNGVRLAGELGRVLAIPVLFMSGYAEPTGVSLPQTADLIEKPFTAQDLLVRVRQALSGPARCVDVPLAS